MPTLTDTATPASVGTDASGSLLVVAGLSSSAQTDSPCVVTFSRPLAMPTTYTTTADHRDLAAAINQVIFGMAGILTDEEGSRVLMLRHGISAEC
jgi:pyruvate/2-oxoacid:ferredoxin oxidoreductase alpha subunit